MTSDSDLASSLAALRASALLFVPESDRPDDPLGRLALIEVTGEDRMEWLQGQVTNDLHGLQPGAVIDSCMLKPTGQIIADCRMAVLHDRCWIETPRLCVPALLERFESMVIMEDVAARDATTDLRMFSLQGPESARVASSLMGQSPPGMVAFRSDHSGYGGVDLWFPGKEVADVRERLGRECAEAEAQVLRSASIEAGIPYYGLDMDDKTLLLEMGSAFAARNVSYTKGCYTGQEIVARIHSRGHTNKTWVALIADEPLTPGSAIATPKRADAGRVTRTARSPEFGHIAGAMLRNEAVEEGTEVEVLLESHAVIAMVKHFPLR